ncbi:MAG: cysteine hydrolase family protein [Terriglobales bacterium]
MPASQTKTKTALIAIDIQRGILNDPRLKRKQETLKALDDMVARIAGLIARARSARVPVIHVQHDGGKGHRLEPNTPGWPLRSEIAPRPGELVIHKRASDSFFQTTLDAELSAFGIGCLVACGCMTQYCVDTTVRRAVSLGYDVVLVADGHMTADSAALRFEQIIAHHNAVLDGFDAGSHEVQVLPASEISF